MLSTTTSGAYLRSSWCSRLRSSTSSVRSPKRSPISSARCAGLARSSPRSSRATGEGKKTLPHSTSIVVRPRTGASAAAVSRTSFSYRATRTRRFREGGGGGRRGVEAEAGASSRRRATAWPTRPLPPRITTVPSRRSMQSLDPLDLARGERAVGALSEAAEAHGPIRDAVQPFHLQAQLLGQAAHDPLPALREGQRHFDAAPRSATAAAAHFAHARLYDPDRPSVDYHTAPQSGTRLGGGPPVYAKPVGAGHRVARVHEAVRPPAVGGEQQQPGGHDVQPSNVREARHIGEEVEDGASPGGVAPAHHNADRLVEGEPCRRTDWGLYGPTIHHEPLAVRIDTLAHRGDHAVHPHPTSADQIFGFATGGHTCPRQGALQAHQGHSGWAGAGGRSATDSSSSRGS